MNRLNIIYDKKYIFKFSSWKKKEKRNIFVVNRGKLTSMFGSSNITGGFPTTYSSAATSVNSLLQQTVICEDCGQRYNDLVSKYTHQIYYCMGRDLSLEASLLRIRNNVKVSRLPSVSYVSRVGRGPSFSHKYPVYSTLNERPESRKTSFFSSDLDTKSERGGANSHRLPVSKRFFFYQKLKIS